ncbi:MAG: hypothetical protein QHC78_16505 [Pigmentiphaga sp.]|uniref:hypothetical protein n=1 Tax=Pigmentiphaga sp. TaxID=1977564 RepID=UPI0029B2A283|nr:hypothetical protein [Pigmentiphaga sp.]MDX3907292.1 hypothetical protein [Pigmentiphaga sp.]
MRHHDASKLMQRRNVPPGAAEPQPLPVEDSLADARHRIGSTVSLRSAADPSVLVTATIRERVSLEFTADITGFSNGAATFDGMAAGDAISFDESYVIQFSSAGKT